MTTVRVRQELVGVQGIRSETKTQMASALAQTLNWFETHSYAYSSAPGSEPEVGLNRSGERPGWRRRDICVRKAALSSPRPSAGNIQRYTGDPVRRLRCAGLADHGVGSLESSSPSLTPRMAAPSGWL